MAPGENEFDIPVLRSQLSPSLPMVHFVLSNLKKGELGCVVEVLAHGDSG